MVLSVLLVGISRNAKPLRLFRSVHGEHLLKSKTISNHLHHNVTVKQDFCHHYHKTTHNVGIVFTKCARYLSNTSLNMKAEDDVKKALSKEADKIAKDVDKNVDKIAKGAAAQAGKSADKIVKAAGAEVDKNLAKAASGVKVGEEAAKLAKDGKVEELAAQIIIDKDYSKIYHFRQLLNMALLVVIPAAVVANSPATDYLFVLVAFLHNHFSFETIINDYVSEYNFGKNIPKVSQIISIIISVLILIGLVNVIQNDIGIAQTFLCLWKVGKKDIEDEIERLKKEMEEAAAGK